MLGRHYAYRTGVLKWALPQGLWGLLRVANCTMSNSVVAAAALQVDDAGSNSGDAIAEGSPPGGGVIVEAGDKEALSAEVTGKHVVVGTTDVDTSDQS